MDQDLSLTPPGMLGQIKYRKFQFDGVVRWYSHDPCTMAVVLSSTGADEPTGAINRKETGLNDYK